ncbi:golvesin C-terminal-like domain-containing protein [Bizionia gelidisalsuginis]|nr:T9SS type A sorting domain-containing protein [Bizionia gelidisalsuginis]
MKRCIRLKSAITFLIFILSSTSLLFAQITVNSNFEGGNGIAAFTDTDENEVHIVSELKGGDTKNISYYVEISGLNPALPLTLEVSAHWSGPTIVYSYDNINWEKTTLTNLNNFTIPLQSSSVYVAHSYPYTYSNMITDVSNISDLSYVTVSDLAISEGGRAVKLVKITDDCVNDNEKELIWMLGRMHAFENPGNYSLMGMLDFFASNHPSAIRLREEAIIYIVPIMDVDHAYNGGSGKDQTPVDFNRDWHSLSSQSHWNAVNAAKSWIDSTAQLNNFSVFVDSHSPPPSGQSLFYYIYDSDHHYINTRFVTETVKHIGNYQGTEEIYYSLYNAISQDYIITNYDNAKHYNVTIETGFNNRTDGVEWTKDLYLLNGQYHGQAISDYIHGQANTNDIIIDNNDAANVVLNGNWLPSTNILGYYGDNYLSADTTTPSSAVFNATINTAGTYEIFTRWVSKPNFATNALASFTHSGVTDNFSIDMSLRGGNWVSLETYYLEAGEQVSLAISNTNANETVIADGLRISEIVDCESLSILDIQQEHFPFSSKLYPNPTKKQFTIQLENNTTLETVKVYDMLGHLVLTTNKYEVDTTSLGEGLYTVEIKTNKGRGIKKLVIR